MVGSSQSIAGPNTMLNTIVADVISRYADRLENAEDFDSELEMLLRETIRDHKKIVFNGNSYSDEWKKEAERRGLLNLPATPDALAYLTSPKNIALFGKHKVYSEIELRSRCEILYDFYVKTVTIEANTMVEMVRRDIIPAVYKYIRELSESIEAAKTIGIFVKQDKGVELVRCLLTLVNKALADVSELEKRIASLASFESLSGKAEHIKLSVIPQMDILRSGVDEMETLVGAGYWPYPVYSEMLNSL